MDVIKFVNDQYNEICSELETQSQGSRHFTPLFNHEGDTESVPTTLLFYSFIYIFIGNFTVYLVSMVIMRYTNGAYPVLLYNNSVLRLMTSKSVII